MLESPDLGIAADRANSLAQARAKELTGLVGLPEGESRRASCNSSKNDLWPKHVCTSKSSCVCRLTAPFSGDLYDLDEQLAPGVWVHPRQPLAIVVDPAQWVVEAYIAESDVGRVHPGNAARGTNPIRLTLFLAVMSPKYTPHG